MNSTETNKLTMEGIWLGRLHIENHLFAEFKPVAELSDGRWKEIENRLLKFPKQGYVWAERGDLGMVKPKGSIWIFECRPSGKAVHQCLAVEPKRALPIIDLSSKSSAEVKRQLLEVGVSLPEHQGSQAVVLLQNDTCCSLRFEPQGQLSIARLPANGIIEVREADPKWKESYRVDNYLFLPARTIPSRVIVGQIDWSTNADFLVKVIDRYRAAVSGYCGLEKKTTDPAIRRLEKALAESRVTGSDAIELAAIADRMRAEWQYISQSLSAVRGIGDLLLESEPGKRLLQEAIDAKRNELASEVESEVRTDIESCLASRRKELAELDRDVEEETSRRDAIRKEIAVLAEQHSAANSALRAAEKATKALAASSKEFGQAIERLDAERREMQSKLAEEEARRDGLIGRIESLKSTIAEFGERARREFESAGINYGSLRPIAARLESLFEEDGPVPPFLPGAMPPWWSPTPSDSAGQITTVDLQRRVEEEASDAGILLEDMQLFDVFARSGELVLLLGSQADSAIAAYARAVCGAAICTHALDPSGIGLDDIWRVPATGQPTAFAHAWHRAQVRTEETVLLCLRDLDASPFHLWIASLVSAMRSALRPRNLLVVATAMAGSGPTEDYRDSDLRRYLVALAPRADAQAHLARIVHDDQPAATTLLVRPWEAESISPNSFRRIAQAGRDSDTVRRALRVAGIANKSLLNASGDLPSIWSDYLVDGQPDKLPAALMSAHEALRTLHFQR